MASDIKEECHLEKELSPLTFIGLHWCLLKVHNTEQSM